MAYHIVDQEMMKAPGLATLQHYYTIPWYIMVKFARWDDILREELPDADLAYPSIVLRYARGMAFAARGNLAAARSELQELRILAKNPVLASMTIWDINGISVLVAIADAVLTAEIHYREGDLGKAVSTYQKAVEMEENLNYNEPPDWFFSIKHALGHVLVESGRLQEAEQVYRSDLSKLRNNGWALMGLYRCLSLQGRKEEAQTIKKQFDTAWQWADVQLSTSVL
jgi:tetratricopeptide (TPR) repeat protein